MSKTGELYEAMRRAVANNGRGSHKSAFTAFMTEMRSDPKFLALLAKEYFDREYPKWDVDQIGRGRVVVIPPEVRAKQRAASNERVTQEISRIKGRLVHMCLLDLILPGGKRLRHSTFADCAKAGGWFVAIAKHGKPSESVDKKLSETDLRNIWKRYEKVAA